MKEAVNHPEHYGAGAYETINVIEAWSVSFPPAIAFHLGNTLKYIARSNKKSNLLEDLRKARWYLDRAITFLESAQAPTEPEKT